MNPSELIDALAASADILEQFIGRIPEDRMERKRGDGIWTVQDHLHHLTLVQPVMYKRIRAFKLEESPRIHAYNPGPEEEKERSVKHPTAELVRTFREWRTKQVELARSCGLEVWARSGDHPEFDAYSLEIVLRHIWSHDGWHIYRMEQIWLAKDEALTPA
jgi:hypothetical protein